MAFLYITEYIDVPQQQGGMIPMGSEPGVDQAPLAIAGASAASAAFAAATKFVRLHTDAVCSVKFGTVPVATSANKRLAANATEYFAVAQGQTHKVAVITNT